MCASRLQTYCRWRKKYAGLMPSEMKRQKLLEEENTRLKKLVADLSLDKACCRTSSKESNEGSGSWWSIFGPVTESTSRCACGALRVDRSTYHHLCDHRVSRTMICCCLCQTPDPHPASISEKLHA